MIDFLLNAAIVIVVSGAIGLLIWKLRSRPSEYASIYVDRKEDADFWEGKPEPDKGFTAALKREIYYAANGKCQITGKRVSLGEADNRSEAIQTAFGMMEEGEVDHIISRKWGGPSVKWNGRLVRRKINRDKSGDWTREAEKLCAERGLKVYIGKRSKKFVS